MKAKYILISALLACQALMYGQTMRWVPVQQVTDHGKCDNATGIKGINQCWSLEYTPAVSGVLTSYTTGFLVTCTSLGSPVLANQSCSMTPNNRVIDGCGSLGLSLLNSSGNTGTMTNNQIQAGQPVILHQVCFTVPPGESVQVEEDSITDLTTSVDLGNQQYTTEFPVYETTRLVSTYVLPELPGPWLDFQVRPAGPLTAQIDWSATDTGEPGKVRVERSYDGELFETVHAKMDVITSEGISLFRVMDVNARPGINYYRLLLPRDNGDPAYSPVRTVFFGEEAPSIFAWPNPADENVNVRLGAKTIAGSCFILDASGKERLRLDFEAGQSDLEFDVQQLEPGTYTLVVSGQEEVRHEKLVILHR